MLFNIMIILIAAMMMYELHVPLVMMANRAVERGPKSGISKNEIKKDLKVIFF